MYVKHRWLVMLVVLSSLSVLDIATTEYLLGNGHVEPNPLVLAIGLQNSLFVKLTVCAVIVCIAEYYIQKRIPSIVPCAYMAVSAIWLGAVFNNLLYIL